jgi:hypothetical protein
MNTALMAYFFFGFILGMTKFIAFIHYANYNHSFAEPFEMSYSKILSKEYILMSTPLLTRDD